MSDDTIQPTGLDALIRALTILRKYGKPDYPTHCEHDVLFLKINPSEVSESDRSELDDLGFGIEEASGEFFVSYRFWP